MTDATLKATAYHEAGHAVVSFILGRRFRRISIESMDDAAGYIEYYDGLFLRKIIDGTHLVTWLLEHPEEEVKIVDRAIYSAMAGCIAQEMAFPGSVDPGQCEYDKENVIDILIHWDKNGWETAKAKSSEILTENWSLVERLAEALLSKRTLTGKEAREILEGPLR
jgi:hypothetical protein